MSYYSRSTPLADEQIRRIAPSVFATEAHESRSDRYSYIPTSAVLAGLRREGFEPYWASQSVSRIEGKTPYTKHLLRFRHASALAVGPSVGATVNELVLVNSHDGTSAYRLMAGVYRFVCSNGLVVSDSLVGDVRVPHKGDVTGQVIEGAYRIIDDFGRVDEARRSMSAVPLTAPQQEVFAEAALAVRYPDAPPPIDPRDALRPRRFADHGDDLWTTFNRVQENLVRGGLSGRSASGRRTRTREVRGIDQGTALNRALWTLAERMRELAA